MSSIFIDTSQLTKGADRFKNMGSQLESVVDDVLNANAIELEEKAKQRAPVNEGLLKGQISANVSGHLRKEIAVNAFYAAYIEFGTGAYAAAYASSLPPTWAEYAQKFKGKGNGTFAEMLTNLQTWVRLKGIAQGNEIKSVAYLIARSILRNGIKPHPFLYPAFAQQKPILEQDLENALKQFGR